MPGCMTRDEKNVPACPLRFHSYDDVLCTRGAGPKKQKYVQDLWQSSSECEERNLLMSTWQDMG